VLAVPPSSTVARPPDVLARIGKLTGRAVSKSENRTFLDATKSSLDEKIPLNVSALLVNPACRSSVLTSHPNFDARWGLTSGETMPECVELLQEFIKGFTKIAQRYRLLSMASNALGLEAHPPD
jgi:hypothetical protein